MTRILIACCLLFMIASATAQKVITHTTSSSNTNGHITNLSEFKGQPNIILIVSQLYGKYNDHQIGVWYNNGTWTIYNEDKQPLPMDTKFNVLALNPSANAFVHQVSAGNMEKTWTLLNHPKLNNNPNAIVFVTQNWKGKYNPKPLGVWYTGSKWSVFNQDNSPIPIGTTFNVLVADNGFNSAIGATAQIQQANSANKQNQWGPYLMTSSTNDANATLFVTQNWNTNGPYNNHIPAVWYGGNSWTIYNQDRVALADGTKFNVLVFGNAGAGQQQQASSNNKDDKWKKLEENGKKTLDEINKFIKDAKKKN